MMAHLWLQTFLPLVLIVSYVKAAAISSSHTSDGFWLKNLESGKSYTFAVVPKSLGESMTVGFYDVDLPYRDCGKVEVDILDDGYVKLDYNKIAVICDQDSLLRFTATSGRGFHVIVKMGKNVTGGSIKARFVAASGISVTSERLYG